MSAFDRRFLFVTGKGGVGKTTVTASLARGASLTGRRVLLATTDPSPYIELLPAARWDENPAHWRDGLFTVLLEPEAALREYGRLLIKPRLARQALFENRYVQGFLKAVPGLPEWAVLGKAWFHTTETEDGAPRFHSVIFDAPPTGHGYELLRLPRVITEVAPKGLLRRDAELAWELFKDARRSSIVLVTLPEELPTNETIELCGRIQNELMLPVAAVVLNRVRPLELEASARDALIPLATLTPSAPVHDALIVAGGRAVAERAQEESRARLRELGVFMAELPDLETRDVPLLDTLAAELFKSK